MAPRMRTLTSGLSRAVVDTVTGGGPVHDRSRVG